MICPAIIVESFSLLKYTYIWVTEIYFQWTRNICPGTMNISNFKKPSAREESPRLYEEVIWAGPTTTLQIPASIRSSFCRFSERWGGSELSPIGKNLNISRRTLRITAMAKKSTWLFLASLDDTSVHLVCLCEEILRRFLGRYILNAE